MKCILHIGTEKTGTTTIQEFLYLNRKILKKHGYLYTKSAGSKNNFALAVAAYNTDRQDDLTQNCGIFNEKSLEAFQKSTINALKQELKHADGVHTVIFSSEHIQSRLRTDDELSRLKNILNDLGIDQISIIVYLRAPGEIANSLYSTTIKCGHIIPNPPGPDDEYLRNLCDHRNTLLRYCKSFGKEAVIPRIYSKEEFINGSIIDDFLEITAHSIPRDEYLIPSSQNESLTVIALEILRRINREIPLFQKNLRPNPIRANIETYFSKYLNNGERYGMPIELRQEFEESFRESNEWVRFEYFPKRQTLFKTTKIPFPSKSSFNNSELDQIAKLITAIWMDKTRESKSNRLLEILTIGKRRFMRLAENLIKR